MTLGKNIKNCREKRGLSQPQLADRLGISFKTISSWEIDRTEPNIGMLIKMAAIFNITVDDLVGKDISTNLEKISILAYDGSDTTKQEIANTLKEVLDKTDDPNTLELLKNVLDGFNK